MERRSVHALGGLLGGFVPAATAAVAWWLGFETIAGLALIGIVPGAIAGYVLAPWTIASRSALPPSLAAAALGVALGIGVAVIGGVLGGTSAEILLLLPIVLAYGIGLGFPVAGPTAFVAALLLRTAARRRRRAAASVVSLVAVTMLLGIPALVFGGQISARRDLPNLRAAAPYVALLPVRLDWQIANCSPWAYALDVIDTHLDGTRSSHHLTAPPQSTVQGVLELEPGWESTIEAGSEAALLPAWRGPHPAVRDAVGDRLVARFEIAPNGEWSSRVRLSSRTELTGVPLCSLVAMPAR
jgi:hypothetical protein